MLKYGEILMFAVQQGVPAALFILQHVQVILSFWGTF